MPRLLHDTNVFWRLVRKLKKYFEDCVHVDKIGLNIPAKDLEIWEYARVNNYIIVTNDEDFLNFSNIKGFPPKIILLWTGNQSTTSLEKLLVQHKEDFLDFSKSDDLGVLELF